MAYLNIHCRHCGGCWIVYKRDLKNENAKQCPHCYEEIDGQTWEYELCPALAVVEDANAELFKDYCDSKPLFSFDVVANHLFANGKQPY